MGSYFTGVSRFGLEPPRQVSPVLSLLLVLVILLASCEAEVWWATSTADRATVRVGKAWVKRVNKSGDVYLFEGSVLPAGATEIFKVEDSFVAGQWNSADLWASLKEGKCYRLEMFGSRVGMLSMYRNVTGAVEVACPGE